MSRDILRETVPRRADGLMSIDADIVDTDELERTVYTYWRAAHDTAVAATATTTTDLITLPAAVVGRTMHISARVNIEAADGVVSREFAAAIYDTDTVIASSVVCGQIAAAEAGKNACTLSTDIYHVMTTPVLKIKIVNDGSGALTCADTYLIAEEALLPTLTAITPVPPP